MLGVDRLDAARLQRRLLTVKDVCGSGLALWLDASDLSTLTIDSAGGVTQWRDKSGLGNHANQATVASRPYYRQDGGDGGFRGRASIYFDNFKPTYLDGNVTMNGVQNCVYVVCSMNANTNQYGRVLSCGVAGQLDYNNQSYFNLSRDGISNAIRIERQGNPASTPVSLDTPLILVGVFDGASQYIAVNGLDGTTATQTANLGLTNYRVGMHIGGTDAWAGYIQEVVIDTGPFARYRMQKVVGILANKARRPDVLQTPHPYRDAPPLIGA